MEQNSDQVPTSSEAEQALDRADVLKAIATGALVFGIAGLSTGSAEAKGTVLIRNQKMSGPSTLAALERAGLYPQKLNLDQLITGGGDIKELQARLGGSTPGPAGETTWEIHISAVDSVQM